MLLNIKRIFFILFFGFIMIGSAVFIGRVFSYDSEVAHPFLTEKAVELFNQSSEIQISQQQLAWLKQGAIEEDTPIRWMNHFYNPITGNGLWGFSSAKDWSRENIKQLLYPKGNQTWQKAIDSYIKGNKQEAFVALGHILHLIEDVSVPAHTRLDAHPEGDPYEEWVKSNANKEIKTENVSKLNNIGEFFDFLAGYSNKYFLSKDTIDITALKNKEQFVIITNQGNFKCIKGEENHCLVLVKKEFGEDKYFFEAPVHSDYYSLLAPKAISYGAGVIDLFFQEAEKERQKNLEKSWLEKLKEKIFSSPQAAGPGFVLNLEPEKPKEAEEQKPLEPEPIPDIGSTAHEPQVSRSPALQIDGTPTPSQTPLPTPTLPPKSQDAQDLVARMVVSNAPPYPGFGGGGGAEIKSEAQNPTPNQEQSSGAGQESETNFNDQNSNIQTQENQQQLEQPEQLEPQDTTPPDVLLSAADCLNTDASSICLMATTTLNIFWSSSAEDLDYFEFTISNEAITSTTTATSTIVFIENNSSNIFSVRAVDTYGNWSEPQTITVVIYSMPVVINEVAWMGTPASGSDEWIELYNRTDYEIDLNNWILYSETDLKPYINLSGIIPAKGYYLIERTDDNTVLGITADWKGSFGSTQGGGSGLDNGGENLILSYASTTIDEVPYCYKWCGGISNNENYRYSMERYAPDVPGSDLSNWGTNIGLIKNGKNVLDIPINGTPKARNSVNYLIAKGAPSISSDIILTKTNSPYLVAGMNNDGMIQVFQDSSSLTIEPGVVIKFYNDSGMIIGANAKIIAQGAANDQIIFTAFADDEYGGDVNNNGFSTSTPGAWFGVRIESNNEDSVFEHAVFRYGGKYYDGGTWVDSKANLCVWETPIFASNSLFEYAIGCGLKLSNSTSTLSSNIFQNNGLYGEACGIYINN